MQRRQFFEVSGKGILGTALLAATAGSAGFALSGCSFSVSDIAAWVPVATSALSGILSLLVGAGAIACITCSVAANVALAAVAAIGTAVQAYLNAPAANKATLLGKIQTALQAALTASGTFFETVVMPDQKLFDLIVGIASTVLGAISGFISQLGSAALAIVKGSAKVGSKAITYTPKVYKRVSEFKGDLNKLYVAYGHTELVIH